MEIKAALARIADRNDLSLEEMQDVMGQIMGGEATDAQITELKAKLDGLGLQASALSGHSDLTTAEGVVDGKKAVDLCTKLGLSIMNTACSPRRSVAKPPRAAPMARIVQAQGLADLGERAVAVVVEQEVTARVARLFEIVVHDLRRLIELAERIGQARVQVGAEIGVGNVGQVLDKGPDLAVAPPAVAAHDQCIGVGNRIPERFRVLARQHPPGDIREGDRDHDPWRFAIECLITGGLHNFWQGFAVGATS